MSLSRSHSGPVVPPAKAHPLPVPASKTPNPGGEIESDQPAGMQADAGAHISPLHLMDQEIAEEADRILQAEQSIEGDTSHDLSDAVDAEQGQEQFEQVEAVAEEPHPEPEPEPEPEQSRADEQPERHAEVKTAPEPAIQVAVVSSPPREVPRRDEPVERPAAIVEPAQESTASPVVESGSSALSRMMSTVVAAMITLLVVINFPTRFVPESARVIVNWFALSLLLWVPAVWFIALFVVGS